MADPQAVITSNRRAVSAFVEAARAVAPAQWTTPRAPGKWSPGQVTEHVALAYEQNRRMLQGTFTGATKPWYQQLLARRLGLPPLFKRGDFGKGPFQAPDFIQPGESPASPATLLTRLVTVARDFEGDLSGASGRQEMVDHAIFGRIPLEDVLHFLSIHTDHHRPQLSV